MRTRKSPTAAIRPAKPQQTAFDAPRAARRHAAEAIKRLVEWMRSDDARISIAACESLLDRSHGKPARAAAVEEPRMRHEDWLALLD